MSDAIDYCRDCETNVMCHLKRKCMKAQTALEPLPDGRYPILDPAYEIEERACILEYDAGYTREEAERKAEEETSTP